MQDCLESTKRQGNEFQLFLYYSSTGKPVYQLFPNAKIKHKLSQKFRNIHEKEVRRILGSFSCKTIPSVKDPDQLFSQLILPHIKKSIAIVLQPHLSVINKRLSEISDAVNCVLELGRLGKTKVAFDLSESIENTLSNFDFKIDDGIKMSARSKGSGLQAATILASLKWIGMEEKHLSRETIWLLEEPESYLHPDLAKSCAAIIDDLSDCNKVIITTHALSFVGKNPDFIYETKIEESKTQIKQCQTYSEATASIRKSLGLKYSDFFQLGSANLFVEGVSDREILTWALGQVRPHKGKNEFPILRNATIMDFTGVSSLRDFLKHSYDFIRNESAVFVVFDGDPAGVDTTNALNGFFSNKSIPFSPNKDYVVLPNGFPIEGLFPDKFISEIHDSHPGWFSNFNADMNGKILAFSIKDGNKGSMQRSLMLRSEKETEEKGNYAWAKDFISLFQLAENQLAKKIADLHSAGVWQS